MKKLLSAIILSCIVVSLTACGGNPAAGREPESSLQTSSSSEKSSSSKSSSSSQSSSQSSESASENSFENTSSEQSAESSSGVSQSDTASLSDSERLEQIPEMIKADFKSVTASLKERYEGVKTALGDTFSSCTENKSVLEEFYGIVISESKAIFSRTRSRAKDYYRAAAALHDSVDSYDILSDFYDIFYDDCLDNFYDKIYDNWLDKLYDDYYDGILDEAYETVEYSKWSSERSDFYKKWTKTRSSFYKAWSDIRSDMYKEWSKIRSKFYKRKFDDIESVLEDE